MEKNKLEEHLFHEMITSFDSGQEIMKSYRSNFEAWCKEHDYPLIFVDEKKLFNSYFLETNN